MILHRRASVLLASLALPIVLSLAGCSSLQSIAILPAAGTVVLTAVGQTAQFSAFGENQMGSATPTTTNISSSVTWSVSNPDVARISSTGLVTALSPGYTQVLAQSGGFLATSDVTVAIANSTGSGSTTSTIASITLIPGSQAVSAPGKTTQFIAIGTSSTGATTNLTNLVTWTSSSTQIATVGVNTGLTTAVGQGAATITALYNNASTGTVITGTAAFTVSGGTTEQFTAVEVLPGSEALSASGQTGQLVALGTLGSTGLNQDVTGSSQITWSSSIPSIATVSSTGLVTGVSAGSTTITAELTNTDNSVVSATATVAVSITAPAEPLLSLTIIPNSVTVGNLQDTGQFLAIGTFSSVPYVRDLTNSSTLTWISSAPSVFPVDTNTGGNAGATAGIVTAVGTGSADIIAEATSTDGTIQTATATFNCPLQEPSTSVINGQTVTTGGSCYQGSQAPALLATLTVYNEGLATTGWEVTANSATNTPDVLHCGPGSTSGGSVCSATYPVGYQVTLKETETGANFGGWSSNCSVTPDVPNVSNTCTLTLTTNDTVGAIFN